MNELEEIVHETVQRSMTPINANQIYQLLRLDQPSLTINQVRDAIDSLVAKGLLIDANIASYFAVG